MDRVNSRHEALIGEGTTGQIPHIESSKVLNRKFGHIAAKCAVDCDRSKINIGLKYRERSYTQGVQRLTLNIRFAKNKTVSAAAATDAQYLGKP